MRKKDAEISQSENDHRSHLKGFGTPVNHNEWIFLGDATLPKLLQESIENLSKSHKKTTASCIEKYISKMLIVQVYIFHCAAE